LEIELRPDHAPQSAAGENAFTDSADIYVEKDATKEEAVKHKRVWVRVTRLCNQRCTFCLDSWNQNGTYVPLEELKAFIRKGREQGGERLILSGGEASVHPDYIKLIRYGRELGYEWIQTVTNGQMFAYPKFAHKAKMAGLNEATFSMHGHNAKLHDRLVGLPGAFERGNQGIRNLQALGGVVVNVDVVINKMNVMYLRDIIDFYMDMGINEFDLLYIVPFGRGFEDYRSQLFFDLREHAADLTRAFEVSSQEGIYIWTNRFPVQYLEGFEHLIQDPHKLHSEVNGGRHNFEGFLQTGTLPDCHGERCDHCFLDKLCRSTMFPYRERLLAGDFRRLRVDLDVPAASAEAEAVFQKQSAEEITICGATGEAIREDAASRGLPSETIVRAGTADLEGTVSLLEEPGGINALEIADAASLERLQEEGALSWSVRVMLNTETTAWLLEHGADVLAKGASWELMLPNHEYLSESRENDPDPDTLRQLASMGFPLGNVPPCIAGAVQSRPPEREVLHRGALDVKGNFDTDAYVAHYIDTEYYARSLRCDDCAFAGNCPGMHINYIRNHGFRCLEPQPLDESAAV